MAAHDGDFKAGNQAHLVHGGAAAVKAMLEGQPFKGLAAQAQREVVADLEASGRGAMLREIATKAHVCLRLYWNAVESACDKGDLDKLDLYCQRFGWLAGVTRRCWASVREEEQTSGRAGALDYATLLSEKRQAEQETEQENE